MRNFPGQQRIGIQHQEAHIFSACVYVDCVACPWPLVQGNAHLMSLALRSPSFLFTQTTNDLSPLLKGGMTRKLRDGLRNEKGKTKSSQRLCVGGDCFGCSFQVPNEDPGEHMDPVASCV